MKKRILVTGGAGFLGSNLSEKLLSMGHEVICMDNFFTGKKENIVHLMDNPFFEVIRHDVTMPYFIEVDEIYNLACPASPIQYQYNAIKTTRGERSNMPIGGMYFRAGLISGSVIERKIEISGLS